MAKQTVNILKGWFSTGKKPLQNQFWDWLDSFWHKDESIPIAQITGLQSALDNLAQNTGGGNSWSYQKVVAHTGDTIAVTISIPSTGRERKIMLFREGVKVRFSDDFTVSGTDIILAIPSSGETYEIFTQL